MFDGLKKLFQGDSSPAQPPPRVERRIFFKGLTQSEFTTLLREFESLGRPGRAMSLELHGPEDDWFALVLPEELHAYSFHNLANWLLGTDGPGAKAIIAWSRGSRFGSTVGGSADGAEQGDAHWKYFLIPESETDSLIGYQVDGTSLAVYVPDNQAFRGEEIALERMEAGDYFQSMGVPANFQAEEIHGPSAALAFHPEDPGDMNTQLESSAQTRAEAMRSYGYL